MYDDLWEISVPHAAHEVIDRNIGNIGFRLFFFSKLQNHFTYNIYVCNFEVIWNQSAKHVIEKLLKIIFRQCYFHPCLDLLSQILFLFSVDLKALEIKTTIKTRSQIQQESQNRILAMILATSRYGNQFLSLNHTINVHVAVSIKFDSPKLRQH